MAEGPNFVISATDQTAAAFMSVEKNLQKVTRTVGEGGNKLAGLANYAGLASSGLQNMGKMSEGLTVGVNTMATSISVLGGPAGVLAGAVLGFGAFVLAAGTAEAAVEKTADKVRMASMELAELQDNKNQAQLERLAGKLKETNKEIEDLQKNGSGWSMATMFSMDAQLAQGDQQLELLRKKLATAAEIQKQMGQVQGELGAGRTGSAAEREAAQRTKREADDAARQRQQLQDKFAALQTSLLTEEEAIQESYDKRLAIIDQAEQKHIGTQAQRDDARVRAFADKEAKLTELEKRELDKRTKLEDAANKARIGAYSGLFGNLASLMGSKSKTMFEIGKQAAKAQTYVDTYAGAQGVFKDTPGPLWVRAAAAGAAVVAGMMRLQAIESTTFGGGSTGVSVGNGAVATGTDFNGGAPASPVLAGGGRSGGVTNVQISGSSSSTYTQAQLDQIMDAMQEAIDRGDRVIISRNSRQAMELRS